MLREEGLTSPAVRTGRRERGVWVNEEASLFGVRKLGTGNYEGWHRADADVELN